jgi:uncharacterized MnhB-related membrane protein
MLRHLVKPHGIVALLLLAFATAWALWTFVWLPAADVAPTEPVVAPSPPAPPP